MKKFNQSDKNKKTYTAASFFAIAFLLLSGIGANRGPVATDAVAQQARIQIRGTSNLHNWTMQTTDLVCNAKFQFPAGNDPQPDLLTELFLEVPVKNLKSGESLMDSRAYKALKATNFPNITFVLTSAIIVPTATDPFRIKSTGDLSIAGVTNPVSMDVGCTVNPDRTIVCSGSEKLKMTDFKIKPPSFMLGTLKTGNDLTIDFTVVFKM